MNEPENKNEIQQFFGEVTLFILTNFPHLNTSVSWKSMGEICVMLTIKVLEPTIGFYFKYQHTISLETLINYKGSISSITQELTTKLKEEYSSRLEQFSKEKSALRLYTIYDHPLDYPDNFVVRGWNISQGEKEQPDAAAILCDSLEKARGIIQQLCPGAILIDTTDPDPHIAEVWS